MLISKVSFATHMLEQHVRRILWDILLVRSLTQRHIVRSLLHDLNEHVSLHVVLSSNIFTQPHHKHSSTKSFKKNTFHIKQKTKHSQNQSSPKKNGRSKSSNISKIRGLRKNHASPSSQSTDSIHQDLVGGWTNPFETYGGFLKCWYPQNTPRWSFLVGKPHGCWGNPPF